MSCFEFVSTTIAQSSVANGNITWNNLGPLAGGSSTTVDVVLKVIGNCDPATNIAKVEGAVDASSAILETKSDTVNINIDEPPVAADDEFCISATTNLDVLANDFDPDGDITTLTIESQPVSGGTAMVVAGNLISFVPSSSELNDNDVVTFTYRITDNATTTPYFDIATVTITYSNKNDAPVLVNDVVSTTINAPITISVLSNDSDTEGSLDISSLTIIGEPAYGTATVNADGTIYYAPTLGYTGTDQITYRIYDYGCPGTAFSTATVDITIIYANYACSDGSSTLSLAAVPGADSYEWTLPAGASPASGTITTDPTISVDWSGVASGEYTICVSPTNDCGPGTEQCVKLVINELSLAATKVDILCNGENTGEIDLTVVGGVAPYTYAWSNGATIEDLTGLASGTYSVTVTDFYGCDTILSTTIAEPSTGISTTGTITNEDPYGASNGAIDITPAGGTPGYSYVWSNGSTSQDISGLSGGTYTVTITDANGCSIVETFTVNSIGAPLQVSSIIATDILCFGSSTGTIDLEIIGGSGTYTYDWDNDGTGDFDDLQDLTGLAAGTYNVTISDGVNPDITSSATVLETTTALSLSVVKTDILCNGAITGAIDLTVSGGTVPYTYSWDNGAVSKDISNLSSGTYTVIVTDANGCTETINATINEPTVITVTGVLTEAVCGVGGAIDITPTGGTIATDYTYLWSNGATTQDLTGVISGTYSVTVSDDNGCLITETYTVESACIDVVKTAIGTPVNNGDGTYSLVYNIKVENNGDVDLNNVQVVEDLQTVYSSGFTIDAVSIISQPTSGDLALNAGFDGNTTNTLLAASSTLVTGESTLISLELTVTPGTTLTSTNTASVSATSTDGTNVTDSDTASVTFTENPSMAVIKTISSSPINNNDGTYTLTYRLKVENTGDIVLNDIQIVDDLNVTYPGLTLSSVSAVVVTDPPNTDWTINASYDGLTAGDTNLLSGSNSLNVGELGEIDITVTVALDGSLGAFTNTADASATSPANTNVTGSDLIDITFTENPEIGLAKVLNGTPINNGDGTYSLSYLLRVENTGDVPLNSVQLNDDLTTTFSGLTLSAISTSIITQPASTTLIANGSYDGSASSGLLSGSLNIINVGEFSILQVNVTVQLNGNLGSFDNSANASGTGPGGTTDTDISENGTDVDPEGDGPDNNSTPTPVTFLENPSIGIAKTVSAGPTNNNEGTYTLTYTVLIENTGDVNLSSVQATDDLGATFTGVTTFTVVSVTSSTFTTNSSFDGSTDLNLLTAVDGLIVGASGTIDITVMVTPGTDLGPYENSVSVAANSPGSIEVIDDSWNGTVVDPDNDGDPTNNALPTPVTFTETPSISVTKSIFGSVVDNGNDTYTLSYDIVVENTGDVPLNNLQVNDDLSAAFPLLTLSGISTSIITQPASTTLTSNGAYNGSTDTALLGGTDHLHFGESTTIRLTLTVAIPVGGIGGPYENTAFGLGTSPGDVFVIGSDIEEVTFFENPLIGVAKNLESVVDNGDGTNEVTLLLTIENFGDVTLNDLKIYDDIITQFSAVSPTSFVASEGSLFASGIWDGTAGSNILADGQTLQIGEVGTVYITFTVTPGTINSLDNLATAEGTGPLGTITTDTSTDGIDADGTDNDNNPDEEVPTPVPFKVPALTITKTITSGDPYDAVNDVVNYSFQITNSGDVTLPGPFTVIDDKIGTLTDCATGPLAPGASVTCTGSYTITQNDLDNGSVINNAYATSVFATIIVTSNTDTETATADDNPALSLDKTSDVSTYTAVGDVITYSYEITNTGNVTLSGPFTVTDDKLTVPNALGPLAPLASVTVTATYTITQADLDAGSIINIASASDGTTTTPPDTVTVTAVPAPALSLDKTSDVSTYTAVGDVITYSYEITNTGNVTLSGPFTVTDDKLTVPNALGPLAPLASVTVTATYTITQADLDAGSIINIASASDGTTTTPPDTVTVTAELGTVNGHLYVDSNGNGTQDVGEPDLTDVDVLITDSIGNQQTVTTDSNGDWTAIVPPGTTTIDVDETDADYPTGSTQTEGDDPTIVTVVAGVDTDGGIDGYYVPQGTVNIQTETSVICFNEVYVVKATVTNGTILWTTSGDGYFNDVTIEDVIYIPGVNDIEAGTVTLILTVTGVSNVVSDSVILTIEPVTTSDVGLAEDSLCFNEVYVVKATATGGTILWTTSGDGSFNDATIEEAAYAPGENDLIDGAVTLTLTVTGECNVAVDTIDLTIDSAPYAGINGVLTICEGETVSAEQLFAQLGDSPDTSGIWSPSFAGAGSYKYTIEGLCITDTAEILVSYNNDPINLILIDDFVETFQNESVTIYVLDNDTIEGESYEIISLASPENGNVEWNDDGSITYTPNSDYIGDDIFEYTIKVSSPCNSFTATANIEIIVKGVRSECELLLSGMNSEGEEGFGFSPNGDGYNDYFEIDDLFKYCYPNYQMEIYNRWGNKVFDYKHDGNVNKEPIWWDGTSYGRMTINKGEVLPAGTYYYIINLNKGNSKPVAGYIYLTK